MQVGKETLGSLIVFGSFFDVERVHPEGFRVFLRRWLAWIVFLGLSGFFSSCLRGLGIVVNWALSLVNEFL